ncbi:MAG: hypothetical protein VKI81_08480, partial [Synechococcaceae cyanobacterium]|nr:hypothetical protein [Synechococcaceae cyanobacterium]
RDSLPANDLHAAAMALAEKTHGSDYLRILDTPPEHLQRSRTTWKVDVGQQQVVVDQSVNSETSQEDMEKNPESGPWAIQRLSHENSRLWIALMIISLLSFLSLATAIVAVAAR